MATGGASATIVMKILGFASGRPCPIAGQFLKTFDFEACDGRGHGTFTKDVEEAMEFETIKAATEFWMTSPKCRPTREDGEPNRPLTASSVEIFLKSTTAVWDGGNAPPPSLHGP